MNDLISRAAAIDEIGKLIKEYREKGEDEVADGMIIARRYGIKYLPTVDAIPVVHGRWIDIPNTEWDQKMCSVCGDYFCCQNNYCPNCGAKMNLEELNAKESN